MQTTTIQVRHNMEVAHRLYLTPGKCQQIHGHSMWVTLTLRGRIDHRGFLEGIDFADLKKSFRDYIDTQYDHHLLMNMDDPWAKAFYGIETQDDQLPGLSTCPGDPTTENLAMWIGTNMRSRLHAPGVDGIACQVKETSVNFATWSAEW